MGGRADSPNYSHEMCSDTFCLLAISCKPGYQNVSKDLKQSTSRRFMTLAFDYPAAALEAKIMEINGIRLY